MLPILHTNPHFLSLASEESNTNHVATPQQNTTETTQLSMEEKFILMAQARLNREPLPVIKMPDQNDPQFIATVEAALYSGCNNDSGRGGQHQWVSTSKIEGFLFKQRLPLNGLAEAEMKMQKQVNMIEKARKICEKHNLYLLCVPQSAVLSFNDKVMIQEKLDLEHNWDKQKKLYKWATREPRLVPYIKEVFQQLIVFACEMRYRDAKYINNPLTRDGRVALIDLDENGPGLGGDQEHGIFRMIPLDWYDEFTAYATPFLQEEDRKPCLQEIEEIREQKKNKLKLQKYYADNEITQSSQPIKSFDKAAHQNVPDKIAAFADMFTSHINKELKNRWLSLKKGRHLKFDDTKLPHIGNRGYWEVFEAKYKGLATLKELGYIYDYSIEGNQRFFWVTC